MEELPSREPLLQTVLLLSIVKFDAFEFALEKATELGVCRIVPLVAVRSEKSLLAAAPKRAERWKKILLEARSEEHTSELQSRLHLVCRLLLEKKKKKYNSHQRS